MDVGQREGEEQHVRLAQPLVDEPREPVAVAVVAAHGVGEDAVRSDVTPLSACTLT